MHLKLQLQAHGAPADSALTPLGDPPVQLTVGLSWLASPRWRADFSFTEDLSPDTTSDFGVQLALSYR